MALAVINVGAFDAKTHFSELLRKVQDGTTVRISKNGKQVAVLQGEKEIQNTAAMEAHRRIMRISSELSFRMEKKGVAPLTASDIKEMKDYGRKY